MDQRVSGAELRRVGEETNESSGDFVDGLVLHNANSDVQVRIHALESCKVGMKVGEEVIDDESSEQRRIGEASVRVGVIEGGSNSADTGAHGTLFRVDRIENSQDLEAGVVLETMMVTSSGDTLPLNEELGAKLRDTTTEKSKKVVSEVEKSSCVIDVKSTDGGKLGDSWDGERVCRICHLSSEQPLETSTSDHADTDLIHLGCGCKDELGIAHINCAEVWFKLKGNRFCEICGECATNITGVGDNGFMEEWNEGRFVAGSGDPSNEGGGCWRGQPFCNFLLACLVIAFVLPWFFRVNMF